LFDEYEEIVFFLSQNSNESIQSIKNMSHGERISFQKRLLAYLKRKNKSNKRGFSEDE
jgi:hypothetical protein